jgi:hypothetical protein
MTNILLHFVGKFWDSSLLSDQDVSKSFKNCNEISLSANIERGW